MLTSYPTRSPIRRCSDLLPPQLLTELRKVATHPGPLYHLKLAPEIGRNHFLLKWGVGVKSRVVDTVQDSIPDIGQFIALANWLREGPKIVDVSKAQYRALANVEVRINLSDYQQPFNTVLVNLPPGHLHQSCLLSILNDDDGGRCLVTCLMSGDHKNNIASFIGPNSPLEVSLGKYDADCIELADYSTPNLRVAINMMLAMSNFGCMSDYAFPAEAAQEKKYIAKGDRPSRNGQTASMRLSQMPMLLTLNREVKLWHTHDNNRTAGEPTGREMPFHWRRGHWRKAKVGVGRTETKLVFVKPCMVRGDLLTTTPDTTTTIYK